MKHLWMCGTFCRATCECFPCAGLTTCLNPTVGDQSEVDTLSIVDDDIAYQYQPQVLGYFTNSSIIT